MTGRLPPVEITDLITPAPARRSAAVARLTASGQGRAARLVAAMPAADDVLDAAYVAALLRRVHAELQRFGEELALPQRVAHGVLQVGRRLPGGVRRVVDLGRGSGYVLRWLSLDPRFADVELVGVDHDEEHVRLARVLAEADGCRARFVVGDALAPGVAVEDPTGR